MLELFTPDSVLHAMKSGIPDAEWLVKQIESENGWYRFPDYFNRLIPNLKIESYPLLYASEGAIAAVLYRGWMTADELRTFEAEMMAATAEERGELIIELGKALDGLIERIEIPKTSKQQEEARRAFEALSPEDQRQSIHVSQHFFCCFFASFYQNLSMMVHGEKLTSLVAQAKSGNDKAFAKAVQIDKRILTADPYFSERFSRAQMEPSSDFYDDLAYRIKAPPYKGKIRHKTLWLAFSILDGAGLLDSLSYREIMEMCDEAGVGGYDNRIQTEKHLGSRLREYREFQKRGIVTTT